MSTISAASSAPHTSHKQHILDAIGAQAKAGTISSTDQTALDGAVDDIDTDLTSGSTSGSSSTTRLDPSQIKDRINTLIDGEVSNGKLTTDQAATLKDVFSKSGGQGGPGGPTGAGGPPPGGPPPGGSASASGADATTLISSASGTSSTSTSATTASSASDLITSFLKQLQDTQSASTGYSATGSSDTSKAASALLVNFQA